MIKIVAQDIDTAAVVRDILEKAKCKAENGTYAGAGLNVSEMHTSLTFANNEEFLVFYLESLRDAAFVDISDFEIVERRARFSRLLIPLKRTIWSLLRFYTYRLWSQQNQINGLLLAAVEGIHEQQKENTSSLEARIKILEEALAQRHQSV